MRPAIKLLSSSFLIVITILTVFLASFLKYSIEQGKLKILPAFQRPVLHYYKPKTGDVVMMHYASHGMIGIPVAEHWPTHAAMVWVQKNGKPYIIECTKFSAPALPNTLEFTKDKERGVRCVEWEEYVNSIDNVMYIRELEIGTIKTDDVYKQVESWAKHIDFETRIADSMSMDLTVAIGFSPVWPKLSEWCAHAAKLHELERRKDRAFCSEFVSQLLQRLGAIKPEYKTHYQMSPASFLSSVGSLDKIANENFKWKEDRMIVRRL